ncbi:MAG: 3-deoxy-D-manno-octulosonic acid transferase [Alphaproteobacteria bacterium]|nr:3-deoxy-D-manno-octulosonic acid transferase [Alphaproteobacteria bacterium]MBL7099340.1 3-deoxy-D-manno-octulosonic acid transferase [Alphaproteobacteria bacterium]
MARPLGILAYRAATAALSPVAPMILRRRKRQGKEHRDRAGERLGYANAPRAPGKLVWVHGASNGESLAALPLIEELTSRGVNVLMTSGTVTSAELMQARLPKGAVHQFVPIDTPSATRRFLAYWKPDAGLFVDSDLWPNLILGAQALGTKLALVNARMSQRSYESWRWAKKTARTMLAAFDVCLAQDDEIAARFRMLGAPDVRVVGSLKEDAPPLPYDPSKLAELRAAIGARPVLLAAQTHPGEDETILPAHDALRRTHSDLLTIIVPRHTTRGADIAMLCDVRKAARRSSGEAIDPDTAVYIADTMGELGLFYRLAPIAFVGGTLVPVGGHNPLEPARLRCGVMAGPHTFNSVSAYAAIFAAQGLGLVQSSTDIAALAARVFDDPSMRTSLGEAAARGAEALGGAVDKTLAVVDSFLGIHARA